MSKKKEDPIIGMACGESPNEALDSYENGNCPYCQSEDYEVGYGMAAGGCGSYYVCNFCGEFFNVMQDSND